jgi:exopolyphosphatase/guanosine-5'-triphosphate,3'-diphosphate pyrophosphatase
LLVYRGLLVETSARGIAVPDASLRAGLMVDLVGHGPESDLADFSQQVLASAESLGEKYRYDARHARVVSRLATRLFDEMQAEHGLPKRDRLLLEVAALLHDVGLFVGTRAHHKHAQYILQASEIFGLSADDRDVIGSVCRYHRRGMPQKAHLTYTALDRQDRVRVNKLAAILRVANALDAEHLDKVRDVRVVQEDGARVLLVDGTGDLAMERLAATARADLFTETFGGRLVFRVSGGSG